MATLPDIYGRRPTPQDQTRFVGVSDQSRTAQAIGQVAGQVAQIGEQYQNSQDVAAVSAARRALDDWERAALFDPEKGAIHKRGQDAFGVPDALREDFDKTAGKVLQGLTTQRQREAFQDVADGRRNQVLDWAAKHAGRERESFEEGQYQADVKSFVDRAALFHDKADAEVATLRQRTIGYMRDRGRSTEEINAALRDVTDKAHIGVVSSLLNANDDAGAQAYYERNRAGMSADVGARIGQEVKARATLLKAQSNADELAARGVPQADAIAETRKKFAGQEEEAAVQQLKTRYAEAEAARIQEVRQVSNSAWSVLMEKGSMSAIPAQTMAALRTLAPEEERDMRRYLLAEAERRRDEAAGRQPKTDWPTYIRLRDYAAQNPDGFVSEDLGKYSPYIAGAQLEQLQDMKDKLQNPKAAKETIGLQNQITAAVNSLKLTGAKSAEKKGMLQSAIYDAVDQAQAAKGKALTFKERQQEIDKLLIAGEVESGHWWQSDPDVRLYEVAGDAEKRSKFAPTISDADRATLVQRFAARGVKAPTNDQIISAYRAWKKL